VNDQEQKRDQQRPKKGRSPSYPAIDLEAALARARSLYKQERMNPAPISAIVGHWGYSTYKSGAAAVQYAALKKFGLLSEEGSGEHRQGKLTDLAFAILHHPDEAERSKAIEQAALMPSVHRELWDAYGLDLPSDATLRYWLVTQRAFTDAGAEDFIRQYKATIEYAKGQGALQASADRPADVAHAPADSEGESETDEPKESGVFIVGSSRRPTGRRVTRIPIPLVGGQQVFIEGDFPITEEAWANLLGVLEAFKPGLVRSDPDAS